MELRPRIRKSARRPRRAAWFVAVAVVALLAFAAWRWFPRSGVPASAQMRAAMARLVSLSTTGIPRPQPAAHPKTDRERLLAAAFALEGVPYEFGAKGPATLDCSGFTKKAYAAIGVALPDGSFNQAAHERELADTASLVPGDLLFYRWAGSDRISHVTMYAGDGWIIGTGSPGQPKKVVVYPMASDLLPDGRVITYRHVTLPDEK